MAIRIDRRLSRDDQSGKRQVVGVMRSATAARCRRSSPAEAAAVPAIRQRIGKAPWFMPMRARPGTSCTPGSPCSASPPGRLQHRRCLHQCGGSYFSRLRRGELGHHRHIARCRLDHRSSDAQDDAAWSEDSAASAARKTHDVVALAMQCRPSVRLLRLLAACAHQRLARLP